MRSKIPVSLLLLMFILSSCSTFKTIKALNAGTPESLTSTIVPMELSGNNLLVQVKLNDHPNPYTFIFDTGAITAIDGALADELGLKDISRVSAQDSRGVVTETRIVAMDRIAVGENAVTDMGLVCLDLGFVSEMFGRKIDGVIGNNFVKFFTLTLDYEKQTLAFEAGSHSGEAAENAIVMSFKQSMAHGHAPEVDLILPDGQKVPALIDCGNGGSIILPEKVIRNGLLDHTAHCASKGVMGGGVSGVSDDLSEERDVLMRLDSCRIGPVRTGPILAQSSPSDISLVGYEFLSRYRVIIDYPAKEMVLIPLKEPVRFPDNRFEAGLGIQPIEGNYFRVIGVWKDSPADEAGILPGDTLLTVNGRSPNAYPVPELYAVMRNPDIPAFEIEWLHQGETHVLTLSKGMLLPE